MNEQANIETVQLRLCRLWLGTWPSRAKPTGMVFTSEWAMAWTVKAGKATSFRSFEDTHAAAAAFGA